MLFCVGVCSCSDDNIMKSRLWSKSGPAGLAARWINRSVGGVCMCVFSSDIL